MFKLIAASAFLLCSLPCLSQPPAAPAVSPQNALSGYADEAAVVERDEAVYRYAADGTGSRTETAAARVQSSAALQNFAVLNFPYASGTQALEIVYARVRKPNGTVVETPTTDVQDQPAQVTQAAPMYSDLHMKQLPVRSLAVGDTLEFQVRVTMRQAEVPGEFWGAENFGVGVVYLERRVELRVPKGKKLTVWSPKNPPEVTEDGEERVYRWKGSQLRRSNAKDEDAPLVDKTPPIAWTTFPNWEAVGAWYQSLIAGRDAVTPAIQAKADELTASAKTDTDKVRALYEYVSQHNHYIGVAFGIGRFQPHPAMEVLTNQYGDCKDKHTLLAALLRAKGFSVSAVLIGAGIEMNEKVPMPGAFNHLITLVEVEGQPVWLDATTEVAPYRVLLAQLRDKQALVVPAKGSAAVLRLTKTPAELPFPAVNRHSGTYALAKDGTTKGTVEVTVRGDDEVLLRYAARQISRAQWDQFGQSYLDNTGFFGKASDTVLDTGDDLSAPWHLRYGYTQETWSDWKNYRMGSLLPNVGVPVIDEKKPPKEAIELGGKHTQTATSTVKLPEGYSVELPNAIHLKTEFARFDETYQMKDGSLVSAFTLEVLQAKVPAAEWKSVKKFADDIGTPPWIQVTAKEKVTGEKGPPAAGENNPVAAELVRQTSQAIRVKDFDLARKKSDEAIAVNDKQPYVWSQRGFIAWQRGNLPEAAEGYERELKQHPEEAEQYPDLIRLEGLLGRPSEERKYVLAFAAIAPDKSSATLYAGAQLLAGNHVSDAVEVYRAGAKALPDDKMIQVGLGTALLRAGKSEEGAPILAKALADATDAGVLNDGAYALLNQKTKELLPLAEKSAAKAVELLEAESAETVLTSVNARSFQRAQMLLATWDTLGWVYFAEGKNDLAEAYVRASWKSAAHAEVGLHLGQILEKKGDIAGTRETYEQALTGPGGGGTNPIATELHSRIGELGRKGAAKPGAHPGRSLQEQRTFHVPRPDKVQGSGVFVLQVSTAKTEKVAMVSGDEAVRGLGEALEQLDLGLAVPKESKALLLRSGVLFCSTQATCEFVLTPPESANVK